MLTSKIVTQVVSTRICFLVRKSDVHHFEHSECSADSPLKCVLRSTKIRTLVLPLVYAKRLHKHLEERLDLTIVAVACSGNGTPITKEYQMPVLTAWTLANDKSMRAL